MRTALPALLAGAALLLTACGTETAGTPGTAASGPASAPPSASAPPGDPADLERDGVRITALTPSSPDGAGRPVTAAYEVTNEHSEAVTYTVTFTFADEGGRGLANVEETVRDVGPGRTVRGTVAGDGMARSATRAVLTEVLRVPADEAPAASGACPPSGIRVTADEGDAAMGLRVVGLSLENCGTRVRHVDGYPGIALLDADWQPVGGVDVLRGSGGIATVTGFDDPPGPVALAPGERVTAGLMWRNTTGMGAAVTVPYVRVTALPGADPVMVAPHLDLGTTGRLGVSAWQRPPAS
ncbi:DUF4232 domain-containing protein [Streptomyces sp. MN13]